MSNTLLDVMAKARLWQELGGLCGANVRVKVVVKQVAPVVRGAKGGWPVNLGHLFLVIALVLFFFAGIGSAVVPNAATWGLFALTLGLLAAGIPLYPLKRE